MYPSLPQYGANGATHPKTAATSSDQFSTIDCEGYNPEDANQLANCKDDKTRDRWSNKV